MFLKLYILAALMASSECGNGSQSTRYRNGNRQNNGVAATGPRTRNRNCSPPRLANGFVTPLFKGKMMRFDCNKGYSRKGERYAECLSGRWSIYTFPICIKAGCPIITTPDNGKITYLNEKAMVMLFCEPNYEAVGSIYAHCNGTHWDRAIGTCRETDNTPETSCDFESENICGWMHDADHDFDFERRSGYNNKTISMVTGPHADHTTGIPFQGHYMVINTNTEVYLKHSRLISPLYRISAKTVCFRFYYHMYGFSIGTLRVYMKPESVELHDILLEDAESEAKNDFVVFEVKGTQGNAWIEGGGLIKSVNESFQIIIEAVSGQTRLSDIAFDDVSILTDGDCSNDEDDSRAQDTREDDGDDGVFSVESCVNRCFEERNTSVQLSVNHTLSCSCSRDCDLKTSCCPDFLDVCSEEASPTPVSTVTTLKSTTPTQTSQTTTTVKTTSSNTKISFGKHPKTTPQSVDNTTTILLTPPSTTPSTTTSKAPTTTTTTTTTIRTSSTPSTSSKAPTIVIPQMPQRGSTFNQTNVANVSLRDYEDVASNNVEGEDEHDMELDDATQSSIVVTHESDNIVNERLMMTTKGEAGDVSFIVKAFVIAATTLVVMLAAVAFAYKQYKKSTNPLNYKEKNENASQKANEEFSEIRYLTSDETLDFNLISPDNATEL